MHGKIKLQSSYREKAIILTLLLKIILTTQLNIINLHEYFSQMANICVS